MAERSAQTPLIQRLLSTLYRERLVLFMAGLILTLSVLFGAWFLLSVLAYVMVLPVWLKVSLLVLAGGTTAYLFWRWALSRLFGGTIDEVAVSVEQRYPEFRGRLIAAIQFSRMAEKQGYSSELITLTEQQAVAGAERINFNEVVNYSPATRAVRYLAIAAVCGVALLVLFPGFFSYSYLVYSNPTTEVAPPLSYSVVATPGTTEWVKYTDVTIGAAIFGQRIPEEAIIHYQFAGGSWQEAKVGLKTMPKLAVASGDSLQIGTTLRQVNKSFDYYVEAGRVKSEVQQVNVVDRPRVDNIALSVFYPSYTKLAPLTIDENNGSFSAVVGSRANIAVETNAPMTKAELVFADDSRLPLTINGKRCEGSLVVEKSQTYVVRLEDHLGETNPDPIEYYITAVPDEYPSIDIVYPGFDANLTDAMLLPLKVHIYDDYGFSSLVLKFVVTNQGRQSEEHVAVLHYPASIANEGDVEFNWDMEQFNLYPGDYITYFLEVADNDRISGPKISRTRPFIARLPSLDEMLTESETSGQERIQSAENMIQSGKELVQRMKNAARKLEAQMKDSRQTDWQQQKEIQSIAEKNAEMIQQLEETANKMDSSIQKMQDNALMGREIMEKMEQVQKLFEEVATPEMKEAQKKLMEALKEMDPQKLQQAMKDFQLSQKEMLDRLERTLALLKRMQLEQKMEAMIRKAEDIVEKQAKNNEDTEKSPDNQFSKIAKDEQQLTQALEALKKEVEEMRELMKDAKMEESKEAQRFAEAVEKTDADQNMKQMSKELQQQQRNSAGQEGKKASSKLNQMLGEMQNMQMAMKGASSEEIKQAMRRAIDDANYLSKNQEELLKEAGEIDPRSSMMNDMAQNQQDLQAAAEGLKQLIGEMGKKSPFIAAELDQLLQQANQGMSLAQEGFSQKRSYEAMKNQRDAMSSLNKASVRLMESMEQQSQCENAGSCDKNMAKMESLSEKQNQLNSQTQSTCNNPSPSPGSAQQRETLQRLAGEQGAIRKSLEELEQEFAGSRQVLGRLDDIAREMKEVEDALAKGEVGTETTERQLRVYSRMLEASRSMQRRDLTEERRATSATQQPVYVPNALSADLLNDRSKFEDRLKQFLGDEFPAQYEDQIRAYFRALMQAQNNQSTTGQPNQ